jgi:branched-chain amino acid transport system substrate-binding protein
LKGAGAAGAITLAGCTGNGNGGNGNGNGGNGNGNGGNGGGNGNGNGGGDGGDTIHIGFVESLTGPFAAPGQRRLWATEAAVDMVNEEGGINGRQIELHVEDTETDPGVATTKAQRLIQNENIELMCGTFSSSVCLALAPLCARNEIPYSAGYCATDRLTGADCTPYSFRGTRNNPPSQWAGLGPYLTDEGWESASMLYADYAWGQSELNYFQQYFGEEAGGEILSEVPVPAGTSDFSQYLTNLDTSADIMVFIQAGGDSINLLQDVGSFGLQEEFDRIVTVGAGVGEFLEEGGVDEEVADSLYGINYYPKVLSGPLDNQANREFHEIYSEYADEPAPTRSSSTGWEAIWLFKAIAEEIDYTGPSQSRDFVDTWRGFEMEASLEFPQGDKYYREDNQTMLEQYIFDNDGYTEEIVGTIPIEVAEGTEITCEGDWI